MKNSPSEAVKEKIYAYVLRMFYSLSIHNVLSYVPQVCSSLATQTNLMPAFLTNNKGNALLLGPISESFVRQLYQIGLAALGIETLSFGG